MECYQEEVLLKIGDKIMKALKVDKTALIGTRGQFAKVCIEFDLSQPLPTSTELKFYRHSQSTWVKCVYEGYTLFALDAVNLGINKRFTATTIKQCSSPRKTRQRKLFLQLGQRSHAMRPLDDRTRKAAETVAIKVQR